ncbi:MAG TPA: hypothetical protein VGR82_20770 [Methylomirabilota bacterium]|jgi:hypothetical protein|nr:hypothetical protein [Methylomirabilota bacterium]
MRSTRLFTIALASTVLAGWLLAPALAADDSKVKAATRQVEGGAKKIGDGKVGDGVEETAKGVGHTVVEGAKFSGEKFKESGQAAKPPAKSAWEHLKDGSVKESANAFGSTVKTFFTRLFSN